MATRQRFDVDLTAVVERSRARAAALGEFRTPRVGPIESAFTDAARSIVAAWKRDGGYQSALDEIANADLDLAVQ